MAVIFLSTYTQAVSMSQEGSYTQAVSMSPDVSLTVVEGPFTVMSSEVSLTVVPPGDSPTADSPEVLPAAISPEDPPTNWSHTLYGFSHANLAGSGGTPFWLEHNRYGRIADSNAAMLGWYYQGMYELREEWTLDWGLEVHGRSDHSPGESWLNQAWLGSDLGPFRVRAGRWHDQVGMAQRDLSAGPSIWSSNSRPMTRVKAELREFTPVPFTGQWVSIKGGLSHGWFDGGREVEDFWLHEKYLYGKLGQEGRTPEAYLGLIHMAQWGGYDTRRYGQLPESFDAYWRMFFGREGSADAPDQWQENRGGNSLGSWQAGLMWRMPRYEIWMNKETIFEDGSGYKLRSPEDGVQGINLLWRHRGSGLFSGGPGARTPGFGGQVPYEGVIGDGSARTTIQEIGPQEIVTLLTYEFWYTKSQSGPGLPDPPTDDWDSPYDEDGHRLGGQDDYFHHGVYHEGWSYRDRLIGAPLITYDPERRRVLNNRVLAHHVAFMHRMRWATLQISGTWSRNSGRYDRDDRAERNVGAIDPPQEQLYLLMAWEQSLMPWLEEPVSVRLDVGLDRGEFMGNRAGVLVSVMYRFL